MKTLPPDTTSNGAASTNPSVGPICASTAFGCARDFLNHRFVYTVISPRARGLSIGVNMNPDKLCNFNCVYCEVNRAEPSREAVLDVPVMIGELERTLDAVMSGEIRRQPNYQRVPPEFLELRHVALSGDGEPTLCPNFIEAIEALAHVRALGRWPFLKLVLITNATHLDRTEVVEGLRLFTARDEIWAKLDAGTQEYMDCINQSDISLDRVQANIVALAQRRPVIVQSLFPSINGVGPSRAEIDGYARRLKEIRDAGGQISLVQIYSATRPTRHSECGHLPLRTLFAIARRVREVSGLKAEVF